jgi:hypothetical protein
MKYSNKHKKNIAELFSKADMKKEEQFILNNDKYDYETSNAIREALNITKIAIVNSPMLLDSVRRYENRGCPIFNECTLPECEGSVWCNLYNLGGSHGFIGSEYDYLGTRISDITISNRREIMLKMLLQKGSNK